MPFSQMNFLVYNRLNLDSATAPKVSDRRKQQIKKATRYANAVYKKAQMRYDATQNRLYYHFKNLQNMVNSSTWQSRHYQQPPSQVSSHWKNKRARQWAQQVLNDSVHYATETLLLLNAPSLNRQAIINNIQCLLTSKDSYYNASVHNTLEQGLGFPRLKLNCITEPITLHDPDSGDKVELGTFEIQIPTSANSPSELTFYALEPNPSQGSPGFTHPHINGATLCFGNAKHIVQRALDIGDLPTVLATVIELLSNYNPDNPYARLQNWNHPPTQVCPRCGHNEFTGEDDDHGYCATCSITLCSDCMSFQDILCIECYNQCQQGTTTEQCEEHSHSMCFLCGDYFCDEHLKLYSQPGDLPYLHCQECIDEIEVEMEKNATEEEALAYDEAYAKRTNDNATNPAILTDSVVETNLPQRPF